MKPGEPQLNYCDPAVMVSVMSLWPASAFPGTPVGCGMLLLMYQAVHFGAYSLLVVVTMFHPSSALLM